MTESTETDRIIGKEKEKKGRYILQLIENMLALFAVLYMILCLLGFADNLFLSVLALGFVALLQGKNMLEKNHKPLGIFLIGAGIFALFAVLVSFL